MKHIKWQIILILLSALIITSCGTVPITGRSQMNFVPDNTIIQMSLQEYDKFLKEHNLSKDIKQTEMVKRVGTNIQHAVEKYFTKNNMAHEIKDYKWEFNLVASKEKNAWCMPGGKVVVYEGIMPTAINDTGLAVVLGHEIAHAVAKHGNERMSQSILIQTGGALLAAAAQQKSALTRQAFSTAYGIGTQLGFMLPYSRVHEKEADHLGLVFMTMAGYDPNEAIKFWERMAKDNTKKTPEFLSTHPADTTRIEEIKREIPEVLRLYK